MSSQHVHYRFGTDIVSSKAFLDQHSCATIIEMCEQHVLTSKSAWGGKNDYTQATVDLEVDQVPSLRQYLLDTGFISRVQDYYRLAHNESIVALDDLFVVRYKFDQDDGQLELVRHTDAGDLSFMVALSEREVDYGGGGTFFEELSETVHCLRGEILSFVAKGTFHRGMTIKWGSRYLLVGFCHTDPSQAKVCGNLDLDLQMIK